MRVLVCGLVVPSPRSAWNLDSLWDRTELRRRSKLLLGFTSLGPPNGRRWSKYNQASEVIVEDVIDFLDAQHQISVHEELPRRVRWAGTT